MRTESNLFAGLPAGRLTEELVEELLCKPRIRIERIVSTGHQSPEDFWYDQDWNEWVILLRGGAHLLFEDEAEPRPLAPGDYLHIEPHRRHRVIGTDPDEVTVWLAVHFPVS